MKTIVLVAYDLAQKKAVQIVINPHAVPECPENCILILWDAKDYRENDLYESKFSFCAQIEHDVNIYMEKAL